ncbi:MAG: tRNA (adenosine(37)-N6)-threonylcarbamoyltransferase complex dimerization subunit type 1 TsaB [Marinilabiliales bacterium]|nr:MAG: tRNA (adenosine(37)-N6)-threonylcarbamoyltransferase complex dimerization subunit type 1 TsaB [Marinilabiliales bacterium]
MAKILCIETATSVSSVGVSIDGQINSIAETNSDFSHSEKLSIFIQTVLKKTKITANEIDAVAVSNGPGSYTGLRIGVSTAKGICFALGIPIIAIDTLLALSNSFCLQNKIDKNDLLCPMIDARRMEVYAAIHNNNLTIIENTTAKIIDNKSYSEILEKNVVHFFGNGSDKCQTEITNKNAIFHSGINSSSKGLAKLAEEKYQKQEFADLAYMEPFYLKPFVAIPSKKQLFKS